MREFFPSRLISLRADICWPARSPDLNPCDFFLWVRLKMKVFFLSQSYEIIDDLKEAVRREVALVPPSMLRKDRENFEKHLDSCMANHRAHMRDCVINYACKILTL